MEATAKKMTLLTGLLIGMNIGAVIGWCVCKKFKGDFFALLSYLNTYKRNSVTP